MVWRLHCCRMGLSRSRIRMGLVVVQLVSVDIVASDVASDHGHQQGAWCCKMGTAGCLRTWLLWCSGESLCATLTTACQQSVGQVASACCDAMDAMPCPSVCTAPLHQNPTHQVSNTIRIQHSTLCQLGYQFLWLPLPACAGPFLLSASHCHMLPHSLTPCR